MPVTLERLWEGNITTSAAFCLCPRRTCHVCCCAALCRRRRRCDATCCGSCVVNMGWACFLPPLHCAVCMWHVKRTMNSVSSSAMPCICKWLAAKQNMCEHVYVACKKKKLITFFSVYMCFLSLSLSSLPLLSCSMSPFTLTHTKKHTAGEQGGMQKKLLMLTGGNTHMHGACLLFVQQNLLPACIYIYMPALYL